MTKLLYQGHASFRITSNRGEIAYIDPFAKVGLNLQADLILVTHEHFDHNNVDIVPKSKNCVVLRSSDMLINGEYFTKDVSGFKITAVPAENKNHPIDRCVGYLVGVDELLLYFAGDTSYVDYMKTLANMDIDYAFLPCDGVFNMDIKEASLCARTISAKHTVPIHTAPTNSPDQIDYDLQNAEKLDVEGKQVIKPETEIEL